VRYALFVILFFLSFFARAQQMEGLVIDSDSKEPIQGVTVINKHNNTIAISDIAGYYSIQVSTGDTLVFSHTSYKTFIELVPFSIGKRYKSILMRQQLYGLKETTVTSLTKYQEDSIQNREEFKQPLRQKPGEVHMAYGFGIASEGLISDLVGNLTGYNQRQKRFKKAFRAEEQEKFIDTRYTFRLVQQLTGLRGDSAALFMNAYPMSYDFARAATDLEIKMWIKYNYREYKGKAGK
jgi:hypothetical protein